MYEWECGINLFHCRAEAISKQNRSYLRGARFFSPGSHFSSADSPNITLAEKCQSQDWGLRAHVVFSTRLPNFPQFCNLPWALQQGWKPRPPRTAPGGSAKMRNSHKPQLRLPKFLTILVALSAEVCSPLLCTSIALSSPVWLIRATNRHRLLGEQRRWALTCLSSGLCSL